MNVGLFSLFTIRLQKYFKYAAKIQKIIDICKCMADFYVNYGSRGAKLIAHYKCGKLNITLHKVNESKFVLSKQRHIEKIYTNLVPAVSGFNFMVTCEAG